MKTSARESIRLLRRCPLPDGVVSIGLGMRLTRMSACSTRTCFGMLVVEHEALHPPSLTSVQIAFLVSLLPGPRRTDDCQDAITVGGLLRLNLVAWDELDHRVKGR